MIGFINLKPAGSNFFTLIITHFAWDFYSGYQIIHYSCWIINPALVPKCFYKLAESFEAGSVPVTVL